MFSRTPKHRGLKLQHEKDMDMLATYYELELIKQRKIAMTLRKTIEHEKQKRRQLRRRIRDLEKDLELVRTIVQRLESSCLPDSDSSNCVA